MIKEVQKRDGSIEEFKIEKLKKSIEKAAEEAGIDKIEIENIVNEIINFILESTKDLVRVDSESLRNLILGELDKKYPEIANAWRMHEKFVKGLE